MWPETRRERESLDRHITGNYGEDQLRNEQEEDEEEKEREEE